MYRGLSDTSVEEGEADKSLLGKLNELGTIRVEYDCVRYGAALADLGEPDWRRQALWQSAHGNDLEYMASIKPLLKDDRVAERALKGRAISHQARYLVAATPPFAVSSDKSIGSTQSKRSTTPTIRGTTAT